MNKSELKQLVRQIVKEAIGLGVAETNLQESAPPDFPQSLEKKLLSRYKDTPQKAYATMWKIHNAKNEGNQRVCEMWAAWENKGMNEGADNKVTVKATVQTNVYPITSDEIETVVKKHGVQIKFLGDAAFGTETLPNYSFTLTGPSGQVDALVNELSEYDLEQHAGIDFEDAKLEESHEETDMSNPEEKREVELAKKAKAAADAILKMHGK